jgi:hypothetical protein
MGQHDFAKNHHIMSNVTKKNEVKRLEAVSSSVCI